MPVLPKKVTLDADKMKLFIDGEEFPWYIAEDGVELNVKGHSLPTVTVTIPAEDVHYIPPKGEVAIH